MEGNEAFLKQHIRDGSFAPLYFLYGDEPYLTSYYAGALATAVVGDDDMGSFNMVKIDGQEADFEAIEDAVLSLPLMAEKKCVVVRDFDAAAGSPTLQKRVLSLLQDPPESCVLIFFQIGVQPDFKKSAKWKAFQQAVDNVGVVAEFPRKTDTEAAKLLCSGASRRKVTLSMPNARRLVEQCGNDLSSLLGELDKLAAIVGEGNEITEAWIDNAATKHLEASIYDLSKAILRHDYTDSYTILSRLFHAREKAVDILARLSGAYADLYRAKLADIAGESVQNLAADFSYKGREFVLRNAARDCRLLSLETLRASLDLLAETDTRLKSSRCDERVALEQVAAQLIVLAKEGATR